MPLRKSRAVAVAAMAVLLCMSVSADRSAGAGPATAPADPGFFGIPFKSAPARPSEPGSTTPPVPSAGPIVVTKLVMVADDFVVDVYVNGEPVPQEQRHLKAEHFGAQVEMEDVKLQAGDCVVFHVANNGLRWNGATYFAMAGLSNDGTIEVVSDPNDPRWSACDALADAPRFISEPTFGADRSASKPKTKWKDGDHVMRGQIAGWSGGAIWGKSHSCWLKFVVPADAPNH